MFALKSTMPVKHNHNRLWTSPSSVTFAPFLLITSISESSLGPVSIMIMSFWSLSRLKLRYCCAEASNSCSSGLTDSAMSTNLHT